MSSDQSAAALHCGGDFAGESAFVEIRWIGGNPLKGPRQFGLTEDLSRLVQVAVTLENASGFRKFRQFLVVQGLRFFVGKCHAIARQPDGRLHHGLQRQFPPMLLRVYQSGHRSRHTGSFVANQAGVGNHVALGIEIHVAAGGFRGLFPIVEKMCFAVRETHQHETATADVSRRGMDHGQSKARGHSRVHRIAALLQNPGAHFGRFLMDARNDGMFGVRGPQASRPDRRRRARGRNGENQSNEL